MFLAAVLVATGVIASGQLTARSLAVVESTVGQNWRGSYDLLVARGGALSESAADTAGVIEQNFASLTGAGQITPEQLAKIGDISGVEVAAPLAFAGQLESASYNLLIGAQEPGGSSGAYFRQTRAFGIEIAVTTSDGVRDLTLSETDLTVVTGQVAGSPRIGALSEYDVTPSWSTSGDGAWGVDVSVPAVPPLMTGLIAVDPVAERELLGSSPDWLVDLAGFDGQHAGGASQRTLAEFLAPDFLDYWTFYNGEVQGPIVPVVVSTEAYPSIQAHVSMTPIGIADIPVEEIVEEASPQISDHGVDLVESAPRQPALFETVDLTAALTPFATPNVATALPGAEEAPAGAMMQTTPALTPELIGRAEYTEPLAAMGESPEQSAAAMVATPQGLHRIADGVEEQTYREPGAADYQPESTPNYALIGSYTPADVAGDMTATSYVPLGTYNAGTVRVVEPGDHAGTRLSASFSGRGAVLPSPGAITTMTAMSELRGSSGADLVRVRVSDVEGYSAEGLTRIGQVASEIGRLGLDVRVVAGSSLAPVGIYLPQFFGDTDLGWTVSEWTSLGAAVKTEEAGIAGSQALLVVTLAGVIFLSVVVAMVQAGRRRAEASLLTSLGWPPGKIRRWFFTEDLPALAVVLVAAGIAIGTAANGYTLIAAAVTAGLFAMCLVGASMVAMRPRSHVTHSPSDVRRARSVAQVGSVIAGQHRSLTAISAVALTVLTGAVLSFTVVLAHASQRAGVSRLAVLVADRLWLPQAVLVGVALTAGAAIFVISLHLGVTRFAAQHQMMRMVGWAPADLAVSLRSQVLNQLLPGVIASVIATGIVAATQDGHLPLLILSLAGAVLFAALMTAVTWTARYARTLERSRR